MENFEKKYANDVKILEFYKNILENLKEGYDISGLQINIDFSLIKAPNKADSFEIIKNIFINYNNYYNFNNELHMNIKKLTSINTAYIKLYEHQKENISENFQKLKLLHTQTQKENDKIDIMMINEFTKQILLILDKNSINDNITKFHNIFLEHINGISLYSNVMQNLLEKYQPTAKSKNNHTYENILYFIEIAKNYVIKDSTFELFKKIEIPKDNPKLQRYGLIPSTNLMKLNKLLSLILNDESKTINSSSLDNIADKLKIGFIVFKHIVYDPIEYNIQSLLSKDIYKKYEQPKEYGINEKVINRFKNINEYPNQKKVTFSTEIINEKATKFYVLETLDGNLYRCLSNKFNNSNIYNISSQLSTIIIQSTKNVKYQLRASSYNSIMINKSLKNMFYGKKFDLRLFDELSQNFDMQLIKSNILNNLMKKIDDIIEIKFDGDLQNNVDVISLLHDTKLYDEFIHSIMLNFEKGKMNTESKNVFTGGKVPFSEIFSTFIIELESSAQKFSKELHDAYMRLQLKNNVFELPKIQKLVEIKDYIKAIMSNSIKLVINESDNLFTSLNYKFYILNYH